MMKKETFSFLFLAIISFPSLQAGSLWGNARVAKPRVTPLSGSLFRGRRSFLTKLAAPKESLSFPKSSTKISLESKPSIYYLFQVFILIIS